MPARLEVGPVFVTGADGFIGSRLVERLLTEGYAVRALVRHAARSDHDAETVVGDVTLPETLQAAVRGCALVVHCAAAGGGTLAAARKVNVQGTRNVLEAARASGVRRVVHLSSVAVHGPGLPDRVDESQPLTTRGSSYALSKAEAEALVRRSDLQTVVIRPTCVYGPGSPTWVLNPLTRVRQEQIALIDGGRGLINLLFIDDLLDLLVAALERPEAIGQAFLANGPAIAWSEYVGAFARMLDKPLPPRLLGAHAHAVATLALWRFRFTRRQGLLTPGDFEQQMSRTVFVTDKAHQLLDWTPRVGFDEGMARTEEWLRGTGYLPPRRALGLAA